MSILLWLLMIVGAIMASWFLAGLIVPQSEIDTVDAMKKWAKEELDRREAERREE